MSAKVKGKKQWKNKTLRSKIERKQLNLFYQDVWQAQGTSGQSLGRGASRPLGQPSSLGLAVYTEQAVKTKYVLSSKTLIFSIFPYMFYSQYILKIFFLALPHDRRILVPPSGIKLRPWAVKPQSPTHWTTREFWIHIIISKSKGQLNYFHFENNTIWIQYR